MEQHPVPRNISSFQFHLIGDMTLRQFFFMAGGCVSAFFILKLFPVSPLIKWPIAAIPGLGGLAFAFLPIQERPLDKWLVAFIKSINSPSQYLWSKEGLIPDILARSYTVTQVKTLPQSHQLAHEEAKKKLETYLATLPSTPHETINAREKSYLSQTMELFSSVSAGGTYSGAGGGSIQSGLIAPQQAPVKAGFISPNKPIVTGSGIPVIPTVKTVPIGNNYADKPQPAGFASLLPESKKAEVTIPNIVQPSVKMDIKAAVETKTPQVFIQQPVIEVKKTVPEFAPLSVKKSESEVKTDNKLNEIIQEKVKLEAELNKLKDELSKSKSEATKAADLANIANIIKPQQAPEKKEPTIKTITPKTAVNEIGIPRLPQVPNLIMGIIKDMQNKLLPNIILTIKDTKGVPHRALKTNRLGQFSTATPLQNGVYHIEAEDPMKRYVFDIAEINLEGKVFLPIEIDAKGEKELMREKLTKEIFGNQAAAI